MRILSVWAGLAGLFAALLLCGAQPPGIPTSEPALRNYTIHGNGLTIIPGDKSTYLRFSGGVTISGAQFKVSADAVEVDVASEGMSSADLKLPKVDLPRERISQDPGEAAALMARELKLPQADFSRSALRRIGAAGHVQLSGEGLTLSTPSVVSVDGGRSWSTEGRSSITREAKASGKAGRAESYRLEADNLLYDTQTERAAARGDVQGRYERSGDEPLAVSAQQAEMNLGTSELSVSGELNVNSGSMRLSCGSLSANLKQGRLEASGKAILTDSELGLEVQADSVVLNTKSLQLSARGSVQLTDSLRGVSITAGKVEGSLGPGTKLDGGLPGGQLPGGSQLVASETPVVKYKGSSFTGEKITVTQEPDKDGKPGKTIVEVEGPQKAQVDIEDIQTKNDSEKAPS